MASKTWKSVERRIARFFGAERNPCSGSFTNISQSDSTHKVLYIETKHFSKAFIFTLFKQTVERAALENKTPIVCMHEKGTQDYLIVMRSKDIKLVAGQIKEEEETK